MDDASDLIANVRRAANRAVTNAADREDLAQETLLRVCQRDRTALDGGATSGVRGLVRTIIRRLRIDLWRRGRRLRPASDPQATDVLIDQRVVRPPDAVGSEERRDLVRSVVEQLPRAQREAVWLRYYEGMTFQAIAHAQGVPLNTALARVHEAIKRMRKELESLDEFRSQ